MEVYIVISVLILSNIAFMVNALNLHHMNIRNAKVCMFVCYSFASKMAEGIQMIFGILVGRLWSAISHRPLFYTGR